jgi:hypothetical protein
MEGDIVENILFNMLLNDVFKRSNLNLKNIITLTNFVVEMIKHATSLSA